VSAEEVCPPLLHGSEKKHLTAQLWKGRAENSWESKRRITIRIGLFLQLIGREGTGFALIEVTHVTLSSKSKRRAYDQPFACLQLSLLEDVILTTYVRVNKPLPTTCARLKRKIVYNFLTCF